MTDVRNKLSEYFEDATATIEDLIDRDSESKKLSVNYGNDEFDLNITFNRKSESKSNVSRRRRRPEPLPSVRLIPSSSNPLPDITSFLSRAISGVQHMNQPAQSEPPPFIRDLLSMVTGGVSSVNRDPNNVPLSEPVVNRFPVTVIGDNHPSEPCAICHVGYQAGENQMRLPCFHHFHEACLRQWFHSSSTCPICKTDLRS